jgi:hypothetical protein
MCSSQEVRKNKRFIGGGGGFQSLSQHVWQHILNVKARGTYSYHYNLNKG